MTQCLAREREVFGAAVELTRPRAEKINDFQSLAVEFLRKCFQLAIKRIKIDNRLSFVLKRNNFPATDFEPSELIKHTGGPLQMSLTLHKLVCKLMDSDARRAAELIGFGRRVTEQAG